ncbi:hypothetical protein P4T89_12835 [Bacillus nakamurai]|uniref:Uncharacterized protein n=1 Tax=Bacillus nakamurai TaxID=1793963 RepID=A0A150FBB1_9BACI|nr:hypothetical protein [Bacillus nakamurai]KXZ22375.1 hypothetical protein AXI58_10315 [Bacillus nakamurai]MED1228401.1 hypothetical protein [Bacillus nakamurai]
MLLDEKLNKLKGAYDTLLIHKSKNEMRRVVGLFHSIIDYAYEGMYIAEAQIDQEGEAND